MPINQFYTNLVQNAPILNNQFYATLSGTFPNYGGDWEPEMGPIDQSIHFFARGATLPAYTLKTVPLTFHGQTFEIPTIISFGHEYSVKVYCDKKLKMWNYFKNWIDELSRYQQSGGVELGGMLGGIRGVSDTQIRLSLLTDVMYNTPSQMAPDSSTIVETYVLEGMFPKTVGAMSWSHDDAQVQTFDLTMAYQYYYIEAGGDPLLQ